MVMMRMSVRCVALFITLTLAMAMAYVLMIRV